ncbi:MAG: hypothetical protein EZS26_003304 [Candidatus Ordinivivax streblomastigis]|uniref:Uncharacterized protein n=1 Tax=Candidatus Ordinivivax streblomastigis TaxID=2540710 RepID=A0A5M8NW52_9BACT|nr:MAG: hypothetical protein EZS26_003304 [Candidatus Ordinivivax streblomastigis]
MGRKKLPRPPVDELYATISKMLVPAFILEDFDICGAGESSASRVIELQEKEGRIPVPLRERSDAVFDGHCNPIETLGHSFVCKPVYPKICRRRYKESNSDKHFSNGYDFTLKGLKMVPELGIFLKEEDRKLSR